MFCFRFVILETFDNDPNDSNKRQILTSPQHQTQEQRTTQVVMQPVDQSGEVVPTQHFQVIPIEGGGNESYVLQPFITVQQVIHNPNQPQYINQNTNVNKGPQNQKFMTQTAESSQQNQQQLEVNKQNQTKAVAQQLQGNQQKQNSLQHLDSKQAQQHHLAMQQVIKNQQIALQQLEASKQNPQFIQNSNGNKQSPQQSKQKMESNKLTQQGQFMTPNKQQNQFGMQVKNIQQQIAVQQLQVNKSNQQLTSQQCQTVTAPFDGNKQQPTQYIIHQNLNATQYTLQSQKV